MLCKWYLLYSWLNYISEGSQKVLALGLFKVRWEDLNIVGLGNNFLHWERAWITRMCLFSIPLPKISYQNKNFSRFCGYSLYSSCVFAMSRQPVNQGTASLVCLRGERGQGSWRGEIFLEFSNMENCLSIWKAWQNTILFTGDLSSIYQGVQGPFLRSSGLIDGWMLPPALRCYMGTGVLRTDRVTMKCILGTILCKGSNWGLALSLVWKYFFSFYFYIDI